MKKIIINILSLLVFFSFAFDSSAYAEPSILVSSYSEAIELSKETDLPILVIFSSDNCVYCDMLKKNMPHTENIIICFVDYHNNKTLVQKYNVNLIPDSIVIDSNEKQIKRLKGFKNKDTYEAWLDK